MWKGIKTVYNIYVCQEVSQLRERIRAKFLNYLLCFSTFAKFPRICANFSYNLKTSRLRKYWKSQS